MCHHDGVGHIESEVETSHGSYWIFTSIIIYMWGYLDGVLPPKKEMYKSIDNYQSIIINSHCSTYYNELLFLCEEG